MAGRHGRENDPVTPKIRKVAADLHAHLASYPGVVQIAPIDTDLGGYQLFTLVFADGEEIRIDVGKAGS